ncbi:hypothetical protein [Falsiroseomonas tokyonensis]|nr:hypothetical protein [Falsiroseomonas tokyonensis]
MTLPRPAALFLLLALGACSSASPVAELAPEVYGLTSHASTAATAARLGVDRARRHCTGLGRGFAPTRTQIGDRDYTIAFRCPRTNAAETGEEPLLAGTPVPPPEPAQQAVAPAAPSAAPSAVSAGLY